MASELGCLRCSKLSCYVEFNKMVQSLAQHEDKLGSGGLHGAYPPKKGTGAEYNFFRTLVIMLNQVMSNQNADKQKQELQLIYQWFCINKPLTTQRVKPTAHRPKLMYSSSWQSAALHSRPMTAPASLSSTRPEYSQAPHSPTSTPSIPNFTSTYVKHCLQPRKGGVRPSSEPHGHISVSQTYSQNERHCSSSLPREASPCSVRHVTSGVSVIELPAPPSHRPVTAGSVFNLATSVAAEMALERIMSRPRTKLTSRVTISDRHYEQPRPLPSAAQAEDRVQQLTSSSEAVEQKPVLQPDEGKNGGTDQTDVVMEREDSHLPSQPDISCVPTVSIGERRCKDLLCGPVQTRRTICQPHVVTLTLSLAANEGRVQHIRPQEQVRHPRALSPMVAGFSKRSYRYQARSMN